MVDRPRRSLLPVVDVVLVLVAIGVAVLAATTLVNAVVSDHVSGLAVEVRDEGIAEPWSGEVSVERVDATVEASTGLGYRLAWWVTCPGQALLIGVAALVLRQIVVAARAGDPFVPENVRRLRIVALLAIGHGVLALARPAVVIAIQKDIGVEHASAGTTSVQLLVAVALYALAEVWQRGVDLREEQELTV